MCLAAHAAHPCSFVALSKALKAASGVESASINLATEKAIVRAGQETSFESLYQSVEKAGYEVPAESISLLFPG
jgi:Cu+-exporting ATPase